MKARHVILVVEDDVEMADELVEILRSIDCESVVIDNVESAEQALSDQSFCLVLLDLEIKNEPDSIKGHVEHGKALLRKIRQKHSDHNGIPYWLPVLVVSGHAREFIDGIEVMKDGASDVIQKPWESRVLSDKIRQALHASGRQSHNSCRERPQEIPSHEDEIVIAVPGDKVKRRTRVMIAGKPVTLTDASLKVLLHLMVAHRTGKSVNKHDLGATGEQGFKGISILRNEIKPVVGEFEIIGNDYHGNYSLATNVVIGECSAGSLARIGDNVISKLAARLSQPAAAAAGSKV